MTNRRRGDFRLFNRRNLTALLGRLKQLRLPSLSKRNRRRHAVAPSTSGAVLSSRPVTARGPRSLARTVLGFLAFAAPLAAAIVAFAVPLLGVRAYEYVMQSGYFHVHQVVVDNVTSPGQSEATPHHTREELLQIAGITPDTHVLEADIDAMTRRLADDPWIRWAKIERELPDHLVIHVVEHRPTAYLAAGDLYLVDELGVPFAPAPADLALSLPFITGIDPERLADAKESPAIEHELAGALNIFHIWEAQGISHRYPIGELRLQPGGGVAVILEGKVAGTATEIVIGRAPFREKLFRLEWILEHLRSIGKTAEYVLLDLGDDVPPGAVELGGARVVVKADVGPETIEGESSDGLARARAGEPSAPAAHALAPHAPTPAPEPDHPSASSPTPAAPAHEPNADGDVNEAAPVSGGRPAADPGQE